MLKYDNNLGSKPFLKWAGGKKQLLSTIENKLPEDIKKNRKIDKYFEVFVGGGALFFHLMNNYDVGESYIYDINKELILTYNVIQKDPKKLIKLLSELEDEYLPLEQDSRKEYYLDIRNNNFNKHLSEFDFDNYSYEHVIRASQIIFMNKTCFNGLFRLNKHGEFNVPHGRYKKPLICDKDNILAVSKTLKNTHIINANYDVSEELIDNDSLVYLDPPYRPLSSKSNFTTYAGFEFTDEHQIELSKFYKRISDKGAKAILSNSDPKNEDENDNFFDDLYAEFTIERVKAKRSINSNGKNRGKINEILVMNY
ncbi:Dam family site-specific DNA-(adenine-N6)-methyltransferase [Methanobrevibacter sp.]|uniref:DNA adenine methylase n=1 Tax=Methanobrevibacter sp. TaxID=66852 RepID=UPI0026DFE5C9|nr:Dam family site-specific DNA-(adenine-N6)-methyltransferase [Methanobrevibacter sp.]MDO5859571.1 Dam family site-specific DNA-(adenine-N6)-methyltransferase [Methanobrevibacter sp.]